MNVMILTNDLMFQSQLSGPCSKWSPQVISRWTDTVANQCPANSVLVVDLSLSGLDVAQLAQWAQAHQVHLVGVASHVHTGRIENALQHGFTKVLSKGQVATQLEATLTQLEV
ncbi:MAG: hypothetical protein R3C28_07710 [Pirellulaceae bacterium]